MADVRFDRKCPRRRGFDYRQPGWYFVTCVTADRRPYFGAVTTSGVHLGVLGNLAFHEWLFATSKQPMVVVDAFVVMPNHIHALIGVRESSADLPQPPSLIRVMQFYKAGVARRARRAGLLAANARLWQRSFHDRIVRTDAERSRIRAYIDNNPRAAVIAMRQRSPSRTNTR